MDLLLRVEFVSGQSPPYSFGVRRCHHVQSALGVGRKGVRASGPAVDVEIEMGGTCVSPRLSSPPGWRRVDGVYLPRWPAEQGRRRDLAMWGAFHGSWCSSVLDFDWSRVLPPSVPLTVFRRPRGEVRDGSTCRTPTNTRVSCKLSFSPTGSIGCKRLPAPTKHQGPSGLGCERFSTNGFSQLF